MVKKETNILNLKEILTKWINKYSKSESLNHNVLDMLLITT